MYNFLLVILNAVTPTTLDITQFLAQFNSRWILQFISDISKDLQKLLKYFSGTAIFTFSNTLLILTAVDSFTILDLYLKDDESAVVTLA